MSTHLRDDRNWWLRRFRVADRSMIPVLAPGQGLVCVRSRRVRAGQLRVFRHPEGADMWIVKRVGTQGSDGRWSVLAENPSEGTDSRHFGPVDLSRSWRVLVAVPHRWM